MADQQQQQQPYEKRVSPEQSTSTFVRIEPQLIDPCIDAGIFNVVIVGKIYSYDNATNKMVLGVSDENQITGHVNNQKYKDMCKRAYDEGHVVQVFFLLKQGDVTHEYFFELYFINSFFYFSQLTDLGLYHSWIELATSHFRPDKREINEGFIPLFP
ncbi:hypothetical protein DFA_06822 [Cavenderia fasciculata]|uniref:Uncharacterized protein n=1 Tax=Cavenderia fasciculata TaxID=261658 RepID=F4Q2D5_CACFS|nr:uncharacterized protein DFA_06822 [Cavenderia fasciculata]EGG18155.1 hypothetical protein DFA_06822 [Cavenderia fasciculata]|eukprot:XP_004366196.1 hypothetical protein DFA_06822 [Cavenderia fasciculata]